METKITTISSSAKRATLSSDVHIRAAKQPPMTEIGPRRYCALTWLWRRSRRFSFSRIIGSCYTRLVRDSCFHARRHALCWPVAIPKQYPSVGMWRVPCYWHDKTVPHVAVCGHLRLCRDKEDYPDSILVTERRIDPMERSLDIGKAALIESKI